jgi:hypothetical protein
MRYQQILSFTYGEDESTQYTKKRSFKTLENAVEDIRAIRNKEHGDNSDNWNVKAVKIIDKETGETVWTYTA